MSKSFSRKQLRRVLAAESLEPRALLDAALGGEFGQFASEAELKTFLVDEAVERFEHLFGEPTWGSGGPWRWPGWPEDCFNCFLLPFVRLDGGLLTTDASASFGAEGGAGHSDTNTQVAGVDEGDIIETDGQYVYLLSDNRLTIVDVTTPEHPRTASRVDLGDRSHASEIYLDGDRLLVLSTEWDYFLPPWGGVGPMIDVAFDVAFPYPSQQRVVATVLDVTDREEPLTVSRTEIDGYLSGSRAIDGNGYLVIQEYLDYPMPNAHPNENAPDPTNGKDPTHTFETEEEYRTRIEPLILDVLPSYSSFDASGEEVASGRLTGSTDIYLPEDPQTSDMISIVTIDMHADELGPHEATSVMASSGHQIYMSADNLYLFQPKWRDRGDETSILKFEMDPSHGSVEPAASGVVPGRMLNQFSADEYHPYLRVATTQGWGRESTNGVYVLEQDGGDLEIVGSIEDIAPGENIFSVRFLNYRGYVVTFERVDPLFALNLADPENPRIEGELKVTGFSDYLLPVGDNHLLGIGRDADEETGRAGNLQVSLFDVTDMTNPQLADRYSFKGSHTWSPAEYDHHAVGYYPGSGTLTLPVTTIDQRSGWVRDENGELVWRPQKMEQALHVFHVDVDAGIELLDTVEHPSEVRRSVRVGESLISTSYDTLKINQIADPAKFVGQLHYLPPRVGGVVDRPDADDIDALFREAGTDANRAEFDLDGNALVNEDDVEFVVHAVLQTEYGDSDLDGDVDFVDFLKMASHFGEEGGWADGDYDGDGLIGFSDFALLATNYGQ